MDKVDCIRVFVRVSQLGSFTQVANEMDTSQSSISKKMAWLEKQIGFTLLHRTSRQIMLTTQGQEYLSYSQRLLDEMDAMESRLKSELNEVSGTLKLTCPSAFATQRLAKPVSKFMALHPSLSVEVSVEDKVINLHQADVDIAIRASHLDDSSFKARKIMLHQICYFASSQYVATMGKPISPVELSDHHCLIYSLMTPSNVWLIDGEPVRVNSVFSSDSPDMLVQMARLGTGIAAMPRWMVDNELKDETLVELFPDMEKTMLPMYAVYKSTEYLPYRIRAFIDYLVEYYAQEPF